MFAAAGSRRRSEDSASVDDASVVEGAEDDLAIEFTPGVVAFMQHHSAYMPPTVNAAVKAGSSRSADASTTAASSEDADEEMGPIQLLWGVFQYVHLTLLLGSPSPAVLTVPCSQPLRIARRPDKGNNYEFTSTASVC